MKKVIVISEEKLERIISLVMEGLEDYSDEDFYEVFIVTFRQWINEKLGDEAKKFPFSYLLNKYGGEFEQSMGVGQSSTNYDGKYNAYRLKRVARELVGKGIYTLPDMNTEVKFTEKYQKAISRFLEQLEIPDYVSIQFKEDEPNKIQVWYDADFVKMISNPEYQPFNGDRVTHQLKKYLSDFAGVDFGNPVYGSVRMTYGGTEYRGVDEWVKNELNKKIKKGIREMVPNMIHSMKFEINGGKAVLKIVFKGSRYGGRMAIVNQIRDYLQSLGYNTNTLTVEY
jgi:hypothetical protein